MKYQLVKTIIFETYTRTGKAYKHQRADAYEKLLRQQKISYYRMDTTAGEIYPSGRMELDALGKRAEKDWGAWKPIDPNRPAAVFTFTP